MLSDCRRQSRVTNVGLALCVFVGGALAAPMAQSQEPAKVRVYVGDFELDAVSKKQAGGLSPQFCNEMAMRPGLDIDCEHDLRALAGFEGNRVLVGDVNSPGAGNIMKRLSTVAYVIRPRLINSKRGLMLVVRIGPRATSSDGRVAMKTVMAKVIRKTGQRKMGPVLNHLTNVAAEVERAVTSAKVEPPAELK